MLKTIPYVFAGGILSLQIVAVFLLVILIISFYKKPKILQKLLQFLGIHTYSLIFLLTLLSMLGSLIFSEVLKIPPCNLCWYQRIFMYSQPFLLYVALLRNEKVLTPYLLVLNSIGALIAIYHYIIILFPSAKVIPCGSTSCTSGIIFYFGYINIPLMSLTVFILNILLLIINNKFRLKK